MPDLWHSALGLEIKPPGRSGRSCDHIGLLFPGCGRLQARRRHPAQANLSGCLWPWGRDHHNDFRLPRGVAFHRGRSPDRHHRLRCDLGHLSGESDPQQEIPSLCQRAALCPLPGPGCRGAILYLIINHTRFEHCWISSLLECPNKYNHVSY